VPSQIFDVKKYAINYFLVGSILVVKFVVMEPVAHARFLFELRPVLVGKRKKEILTAAGRYHHVGKPVIKYSLVESITVRNAVIRVHVLKPVVRPSRKRVYAVE
jgi:hypothetical protein